jgi:Rieske Fe-S protein
MSLANQTSRRQFVKIFAVGVASSGLCGKHLAEMFVGEAQAGAASEGLLTLKLSSFPALQSQNSSIRIAVNAFFDGGPSGPFYPILVNRTTGNQFYALEARCTHAGFVVPPAGGACPHQGARFNLDGSVAVPPAVTPLTSYVITYDGSNLLSIKVPGLGYSITGTPVQTTPGPRFQLSFPTMSGLTYEVQFRETADAAGTPVPFFTTANGVSSATSLVGTGSSLTIYVARTTATGFYTVNVKVTQG